MKDYKLLPKITLWVLFGLGILISVLFYVGGANGTHEVAGDFLDIPRFSDLFLIWCYILVALATIITLIVIGWRFVSLYQTDRKQAIRLFAAVIGFILLFVICWLVGSPEEVKIVGYEGSDNVGNMARLSDACLYMTYSLTALTVIALIWGMIYSKILK